MLLELLLDKVFCSLAMEKSKTPEVEVFKIFKKHWNEIWQQFDGEFVNLVVSYEIRQKYQIIKNCLFCVMIIKSLSNWP